MGKTERTEVLQYYLRSCLLLDAVAGVGNWCYFNFLFCRLSNTTFWLTHNESEFREGRSNNKWSPVSVILQYTWAEFSSYSVRRRAKTFQKAVPFKKKARAKKISNEI